MAIKLPNRKWYTLQQAADKLTRESGEPVTVEDLIHYAYIGDLELCIDVYYDNTDSKQNFNENRIKNCIIDDKEYAIDGLFIENGYTPNIDFIKSLNIKLDNNYIVVDENMKTNIDGIYASGDIIKKKVYQIVTAASDGAIAALSIIKDLK